MPRDRRSPHETGGQVACRATPSLERCRRRGRGEAYKISVEDLSHESVVKRLDVGIGRRLLSSRAVVAHRIPSYGCANSPSWRGSRRFLIRASSVGARRPSITRTYLTSEVCPTIL